MASATFGGSPNDPSGVDGCGSQPWVPAPASASAPMHVLQRCVSMSQHASASVGDDGGDHAHMHPQDFVQLMRYKCAFVQLVHDQLHRFDSSWEQWFSDAQHAPPSPATEASSPAVAATAASNKHTPYWNSSRTLQGNLSHPTPRICPLLTSNETNSWNPNDSWHTQFSEPYYYMDQEYIKNNNNINNSICLPENFAFNESSVLHAASDGVNPTCPHTTENIFMKDTFCDNLPLCPCGKFHNADEKDFCCERNCNSAKWSDLQMYHQCACEDANSQEDKNVCSMGTIHINQEKPQTEKHITPLTQHLNDMNAYQLSSNSQIENYLEWRNNSVYVEKQYQKYNQAVKELQEIDEECSSNQRNIATSKHTHIYNYSSLSLHSESRSKINFNSKCSNHSLEKCYKPAEGEYSWMHENKMNISTTQKISQTEGLPVRPNENKILYEHELINKHKNLSNRNSKIISRKRSKSARSHLPQNHENKKTKLSSGFIVEHNNITKCSHVLSENCTKKERTSCVLCVVPYEPKHKMKNQFECHSTQNYKEFNDLKRKTLEDSQDNEEPLQSLNYNLNNKDMRQKIDYQLINSALDADKEQLGINIQDQNGYGDPMDQMCPEAFKNPQIHTVYPRDVEYRMNANKQEPLWEIRSITPEDRSVYSTKIFSDHSLSNNDKYKINHRTINEANEATKAKIFKTNLTKDQEKLNIQNKQITNTLPFLDEQSDHLLEQSLSVFESSISIKLQNTHKEKVQSTSSAAPHAEMTNTVCTHPYDSYYKRTKEKTTKSPEMHIKNCSEKIPETENLMPLEACKKSELHEKDYELSVVWFRNQKDIEYTGNSEEGISVENPVQKQKNTNFINSLFESGQQTYGCQHQEKGLTLKEVRKLEDPTHIPIQFQNMTIVKDFQNTCTTQKLRNATNLSQENNQEISNVIENFQNNKNYKDQEENLLIENQDESFDYSSKLIPESGAHLQSLHSSTHQIEDQPANISTYAIKSDAMVGKISSEENCIFPTAKTEFSQPFEKLLPYRRRTPYSIVCRIPENSSQNEKEYNKKRFIMTTISLKADSKTSLGEESERSYSNTDMTASTNAENVLRSHSKNKNVMNANNKTYISDITNFSNNSGNSSYGNLSSSSSQHQSISNIPSYGASAFFRVIMNDKFNKSQDLFPSEKNYLTEETSLNSDSLTQHSTLSTDIEAAETKSTDTSNKYFTQENHQKQYSSKMILAVQLPDDSFNKKSKYNLENVTYSSQKRELVSVNSQYKLVTHSLIENNECRNDELNKSVEPVDQHIQKLIKKITVNQEQGRIYKVNSKLHTVSKMTTRSSPCQKSRNFLRKNHKKLKRSQQIKCSSTCKLFSKEESSMLNYKLNKNATQEAQTNVTQLQVDNTPVNIPLPLEDINTTESVDKCREFHTDLKINLPQIVLTEESHHDMQSIVYHHKNTNEEISDDIISNIKTHKEELIQYPSIIQNQPENYNVTNSKDINLKRAQEIIGHLHKVNSEIDIDMCDKSQEKSECFIISEGIANMNRSLKENHYKIDHFLDKAHNFSKQKCVNEAQEQKEAQTLERNITSRQIFSEHQDELPQHHNEQEMDHHAFFPYFQDSSDSDSFSCTYINFQSTLRLTLLHIAKLILKKKELLSVQYFNNIGYSPNFEESQKIKIEVLKKITKKIVLGELKPENILSNCKCLFESHSQKPCKEGEIQREMNYTIVNNVEATVSKQNLIANNEDMRSSSAFSPYKTKVTKETNCNPLQKNEKYFTLDKRNGSSLYDTCSISKIKAALLHIARNIFSSELSQNENEITEEVSATKTQSIKVENIPSEKIDALKKIARELVLEELDYENCSSPDKEQFTLETKVKKATLQKFQNSDLIKRCRYGNGRFPSQKQSSENSTAKKINRNKRKQKTSLSYDSLSKMKKISKICKYNYTSGAKGDFVLYPPEIQRNKESLIECLPSFEDTIADSKDLKNSLSPTPAISNENKSKKIVPPFLYKSFHPSGNFQYRQAVNTNKYLTYVADTSFKTISIPSKDITPSQSLIKELPSETNALPEVKSIEGQNNKITPSCADSETNLTPSIEFIKCNLATSSQDSRSVDRTSQHDSMSSNITHIIIPPKIDPPILEHAMCIQRVDEICYCTEYAMPSCSCSPPSQTISMDNPIELEETGNSVYLNPYHLMINSHPQYLIPCEPIINEEVHMCDNEAICLCNTLRDNTENMGGQNSNQGNYLKFIRKSEPGRQSDTSSSEDPNVKDEINVAIRTRTFKPYQQIHHYCDLCQSQCVQNTNILESEQFVRARIQLPPGILPLSKTREDAQIEAELVKPKEKKSILGEEEEIKKFDLGKEKKKIKGNERGKIGQEEKPTKKGERKIREDQHDKLKQFQDYRRRISGNTEKNQHVTEDEKTKGTSRANREPEEYQKKQQKQIRKTGEILGIDRKEMGKDLKVFSEKRISGGKKCSTDFENKAPQKMKMENSDEREGDRKEIIIIKDRVKQKSLDEENKPKTDIKEMKIGETNKISKQNENEVPEIIKRDYSDKTAEGRKEIIIINDRDKQKSWNETNKRQTRTNYNEMKIGERKDISKQHENEAPEISKRDQSDETERGIQEIIVVKDIGTQKSWDEANKPKTDTTYDGMKIGERKEISYQNEKVPEIRKRDHSDEIEGGREEIIIVKDRGKQKSWNEANKPQIDSDYKETKIGERKEISKKHESKVPQKIKKEYLDQTEGRKKEIVTKDREKQKSWNDANKHKTNTDYKEIRTGLENKVPQIIKRGYLDNTGERKEIIMVKDREKERSLDGANMIKKHVHKEGKKTENKKHYPGIKNRDLGKRVQNVDRKIVRKKDIYKIQKQKKDEDKYSTGKVRDVMDQSDVFSLLEQFIEENFETETSRKKQVITKLVKNLIRDIFANRKKKFADKIPLSILIERFKEEIPANLDATPITLLIEKIVEELFKNEQHPHYERMTDSELLNKVFLKLLRGTEHHSKRDKQTKNAMQKHKIHRTLPKDTKQKKGKSFSSETSQDELLVEEICDGEKICTIFPHKKHRHPQTKSVSSMEHSLQTINDKRFHFCNNILYLVHHILHKVAYTIQKYFSGISQEYCRNIRATPFFSNHDHRTECIRSSQKKGTCHLYCRNCLLKITRMRFFRKITVMFFLILLLLMTLLGALLGLSRCHQRSCSQDWPLFLRPFLLQHAHDPSVNLYAAF